MTEDNPSREAMLRAFLAEFDEPCPACGYSLRGIHDPACPECGKALRLRVAEEEPSLGLYLAGLIGLTLGLGFHGLVLVFIGSIVLWQWLVRRQSTGEDLEDYLPLMISAAICGGGMMAWLKLRARVRSTSSRNRWLLTAGCWAITLITTAAVMFLAING